jgi:hypothetical protein
MLREPRNPIAVPFWVIARRRRSVPFRCKTLCLLPVESLSGL